MKIERPQFRGMPGFPNNRYSSTDLAIDFALGNPNCILYFFLLRSLENNKITPIPDDERKDNKVRKNNIYKDMVEMSEEGS